MKTGLAIWHYPHRTPIENVRYFAEKLDSVSMLGDHFHEICRDEAQSAELAAALSEREPVFTVHHRLPLDHSEEQVSAFLEEVQLARQWQRKYGRLAIYSFDVKQSIRDNMYPYLKAAMDAFEGEETKLAIEDFGLTEDELNQIAPLKGNAQFGFLLDVGHLNIRLHAKFVGKHTLFEYSALECPERDLSSAPVKADYLAALRSKEYPIYEMHLHNNDGLKDLHAFLEDGVLDIGMYAEVLKEFGYEGVLTIESAPGMTFKCFGQDADDGIARTIEYWKQCMEKA